MNTKKNLMAALLVITSILILAFSPMPDKRLGGTIFLCTGIILAFMPTDNSTK